MKCLNVLIYWRADYLSRIFGKRKKEAKKEQTQQWKEVSSVLKWILPISNRSKVLVLNTISCMSEMVTDDEEIFQFHLERILTDRREQQKFL